MSETNQVGTQELTKAEELHDMKVMETDIGIITMIFPDGRRLTQNINKCISHSYQEARCHAVAGLLIAWARMNWDDRAKWREHLAGKHSRKTPIGVVGGYEAALLTLLEQPVLPTEATPET